MKLTTLKIKNLFGLYEFEADGKNKELVGKNGAGKTSVIDAIRFALSNRSGRKYIIRDGAEEGSVFIETDTGLTIDRVKRRNKSDRISVNDGAKNVNAKTESFLRDIFTPLQLDPVAFVAMDEKEINRTG